MSDESMMKVAINEARKAFNQGEVPIGAVLVDESGFIISRAHNMVETLNDATQHAELIAIKKASETRGKCLHDCTMYVTLEPCAMCAGAILLSRIKRLVYGTYNSKAGAVDSIFNIINNRHLNHQTEVTAGICEKECKLLLRDFFSFRRHLCNETSSSKVPSTS